jgi:hypothetical protein
MHKFLTVAICGCLLQASTAWAGITVMHPKDLKTKLGNDGTIKSSLANFGHIVYGTSLVSEC